MCVCLNGPDTFMKGIATFAITNTFIVKKYFPFI